MLGNDNHTARRHPAKASKRYPGRGYGRVIDVIELLAAHPIGLTGSEIHRALKLPKSTTFLLLQHLRERGVTSYNADDGRFGVGPTLAQISHQVAGGVKIVRVARPFLDALAVATTEDVYVGIRSGMHLIYVDKVSGTRSVGFDVRLGWPRCLHSTASGKLFLAFGAPELLDQLIADRGLPAKTKATVTEPDELRRELKQIRAKGYAISDGQNVEGVCGLAAPIRDFTGSVVAAVHISALQARAHAERQMLIAQMLLAAKRISEALGAKREK